MIMVRYQFPVGMRYSTLKERRGFYADELCLEKIKDWFGTFSVNIKFAVIMGRHSKIFLKKYKKDASTTIIIDEYNNFEDVQRQILDFLPEAVYYDRNIYNSNGQTVGQQLAFDLDPENVTCPVHGTLADKLKRRQGLSFCKIELDIVRKDAIGLSKYLEEWFSDLRVVYSGRGFHVHVFDEEAFNLNMQQRLKIAREIKDLGFHIDEWVTTGEYRLIRLPYSLNGLVSRIVLPLKKEEVASFDAINDSRCHPKFLGTTIS
jgi:DNA primase catalytic subunit